MAATLIPTAPAKVGTGNYMAMASTHYQSSPTGHLESGLPAQPAAQRPRTARRGAYCGNGGLPFPGVVGGKVQKLGLGFQSLSDGTSKVAFVTESREETFTSWYSGFASYVVGAGRTPKTPARSASTSGCRHGTDLLGLRTAHLRHRPEQGRHEGRSRRKYYQADESRTAATRHDAFGVRAAGTRASVIHGFADAHAEGVNDNDRRRRVSAHDHAQRARSGQPYSRSRTTCNLETTPPRQSNLPRRFFCWIVDSR